MLIFDKFPTLEAAQQFAASVDALSMPRDRPAAVCSSQDQSNALDAIPFSLEPFIVLVGRHSDQRTLPEERDQWDIDNFDPCSESFASDDLAWQSLIEPIAVGLGGEFAGT